MAINKMTLKILNKLFDFGYTNEKLIEKFDMKDALRIETISITELKEIQRLKEAIKAGKLLEYLAKESKVEGGKESEKDSNSNAKHEGTN